MLKKNCIWHFTLKEISHENALQGNKKWTHPLAKNEPSTGNRNHSANITHKTVRQQGRSAQLAQLLGIHILLGRLPISFQPRQERLRIYDGLDLWRGQRWLYDFHGFAFGVFRSVAAVAVSAVGRHHDDSWRRSRNGGRSMTWRNWQRSTARANDSVDGCGKALN